MLVLSYFNIRNLRTRGYYVNTEDALQMCLRRDSGGAP